MSLPAEQLDIKTLNRLDIPRTVQSPQGIDTLLLQKILNLTYNVNDLTRIPFKLDDRVDSDISAAGASFTAPIDARRIIFLMRFSYSATATVGNRTVVLDKRTKGSNTVVRIISRTITASVGETWFVGPLGTTATTVAISLNYPLRLEPEASLIVDDTTNIDNLDDVGWDIEYVEIPI